MMTTTMTTTTMTTTTTTTTNTLRLLLRLLPIYATTFATTSTATNNDNNIIINNFQTLSEPDEEEQKRKVAEFTGYIILTGLVSAAATFIQNSTFALSGERLTTRLRQKSFAAIIKQEISYFDREENGVGFLTSRLTSDASLVKGVSLVSHFVKIKNISFYSEVVVHY